MKNQESKSKRKNEDSAPRKRLSNTLVEDSSYAKSVKPASSFVVSGNWEDALMAIVNDDSEDVAQQDVPKRGVVDLSKEHNLAPGSKLLILDYKSNRWVDGVVVELDNDDDEVLVRFVNGDHPNEWLSMKSQRIQLIETESIKKDVPTEQLPIPSCSKVIAKQIHDPGQLLEQTPPETLIVEPSKKTKKDSKKPKKNSSFLPIKVKLNNVSLKKKSLSLSKKKSKRPVKTGRGIRRLPEWKYQSQSSSSGQYYQFKSLSNTKGKFAVGEKVLAKWSDHRMQKFPAVIKMDCGDGFYDVLFYDGFEKTIAEDNIYKTSEEEIAKYNESKPSEADSFVDIDMTAKHERRRKKRKTFDDFFMEEKDFKKSKKESFNLSRSESFQMASNSKNKQSLQSFSVHKRVTQGTPKNSNVPHSNLDSPPQPSVIPHEHSAPKNPSVEEQSPILHTQLTNPEPKSRISESKGRKIVKKKVRKIVPKKTAVRRVHGPLKYPLEITCHDGVVRRSILITDDKLPPGWTKHAISWVENAWACFLFSPDKYAIHSVIELKKYFNAVTAQEPPADLDFSFPKDTLVELAEAQKDLPSVAIYRKWINKILDERKVIKKVRILPPSRAISSGNHLSAKRVRTLLPRYRSVQIQAASQKSEGKAWRCPKSDCMKKFRKENLLQMHVKHYHCELIELAEGAPKVSDLALARTLADGAFMPEAPPKRSTPKSPVTDRMVDKNYVPTSDASIGDIKLGTNVSETSHVQDNTSNKNSLSSINQQTVTHSIKVMTPVKYVKQKQDSESDVSSVEIEGNEKQRISNVLKPSTKKLDTKFLDDHFPGNKAVKKKHHMVEKYISLDPSSANDGFLEEDSKDDLILEKLQNEEVINCICGIKEEDGLMVQCEVCLCWQHGVCHGMEKDSDVPDRYVCTVCLDPLNVRSSQRYSYARQYLTVTKLPRFRYRTCNEDTLMNREKILSQSFDLTSNLQSIRKMERALTAKINIAQQSDHPKLYLWSTNWDSSKSRHFILGPKKVLSESSDKSRRGPVGEAPIESIDCRLRLLDTIEADQQDIESRLTTIQAQLQALESDDNDNSRKDGQEESGDQLLKQTIYVLLRDLSTIATATSLT